MEKLYYEDIFTLDFEALVEECLPAGDSGEFMIVLNRTAFFPEEGGQLADTGTLNDMPVLDVQIKEDIIYHRMEQPMEVGSTVQGHVDWERRFDFMQQHTGEHIVSGLLHKYFGCANVGFHLGLTEVTMDFDKVLTMEQLRAIEQEANLVVWRNLPVYAYFPDHKELELLEYRSKIEIDGPVRIVQIPGVDICACCAPHVEQTGEIGMIKITGVQNHRGGVRVNLLCGQRALQDYTTRQNSVTDISVLLSAKPDRIAAAVQKTLEDVAKQKETINLLSNQLLQLQVASLPTKDDCKHPYLFTQLSNPVAVRNTVNELTKRYDGYCTILAGDDKEGYRYIIGSSQLDCRHIATLLLEQFGAKGGGTAPMVQGTVQASMTALTDFFNELP